MTEEIKELQAKAAHIRSAILEMIASAGKGHIGGAFSCTDILVALYYGGILRFKPNDPGWEGRDRFLLSKGHSGAALYAVLADLGFFPASDLETYGENGTIFGGHPDTNVPGVETVTGSLGHGPGIGAGLALGGKMNKTDSLTVVLLGDGECHEGSVWEAAMFAGHHRLGNLVAIVDYNGQCVTDYINECMTLEPLDEKWRSFGWDVRCVDGHSFDELLGALKDARTRESEKPLAIVARTVKGKGVSFMEGVLAWHHSVPKGEQLDTARKELELKIS